MRLVALLLAAQVLTPSWAKTVYDRPLDATHRLRVDVAEWESSDLRCCATTATLVLVDTAHPQQTWNITTIRDANEVAYTVEAADSHSVLLTRADPDYGIDEGAVKVFFDMNSRRMVNRTEFSWQDVTFATAARAQQLLGVSAAELSRLRASHVFDVKYTVDALDDQSQSPELPRTTAREYAQRRPPQNIFMYTPDDAGIQERIGARQIVGGREWFAKAFYDGEGHTGVGGIGYFNDAHTITMLPVPELYEYSVIAMLVEANTIWAGRVAFHEGEPYSGGLLQYDLRTRSVRTYPVPDVIHHIARAGTGLFLGTARGLYVLRNGEITRVRMEPDATGALQPVVHRMN